LKKRERKRDKIQEGLWERVGEGGRGKIQIKVLGTDVRLEQGMKGIGAVMCGKRKRLKGK